MAEEFPKADLEALWSPWRVEYFERPQPPGDFLLEAAQATDDKAHLVVARGRSTFLIMNRYPYTAGHLMAVPYQKVAEMDQLMDGEKLELLSMVSLGQRILRKVVKAQGFNVGANLGACAGAGVADHLHLHIVPRWEGDSNFMPVLGHVRIIPEALEGTYVKLLAAAQDEGSFKK